MKKKICLFLMFLLILSVSVVPAFAVETANSEPPITVENIEALTEPLPTDNIVNELNDIAASGLPSQITNKYMVDEAGAISDADAKKIEAQLSEISSRLKFDVVAVIVETLNGDNVEIYTDDYFEQHGYGQGADGDGCIFLISLDNRNWCFARTGFGQTAITESAKNYIVETIKPDLSSGDYGRAFEQYGKLVDEVVSSARQGNTYKAPKIFKLKFLIYGIVAGIAVAVIITKSLESKLKTVRHKGEANDYLVEGSVEITKAEDNFVTTNVVRTPKNTDGGSSTRTSSSGRSFTNSSGRF